MRSRLIIMLIVGSWISLINGCQTAVEETKFLNDDPPVFVARPYRGRVPLTRVSKVSFRNNALFAIEERDDLIPGKVAASINNEGWITLEKLPFASKFVATLTPWESFQLSTFFYSGYLLRNAEIHTFLVNQLKQQGWPESYFRFVDPTELSEEDFKVSVVQNQLGNVEMSYTAVLVEKPTRKDSVNIRSVSIARLKFLQSRKGALQLLDRRDLLVISSIDPIQTTDNAPSYVMRSPILKSLEQLDINKLPITDPSIINEIKANSSTP